MLANVDNNVKNKITRLRINLRVISIFSPKPPKFGKLMNKLNNQ